MKPLPELPHAAAFTGKIGLDPQPTTENDTVIEVFDELSSRINFDCIIAPWDFMVQHGLGVGVRYEGLFSFNVLVNDKALPMPDSLHDHFYYFTPIKGPYDQPSFDRETALLYFHQKMQQTRNLIVYPPDNEGVYRIIFCVPMRIPPRVGIDFEEPNLQAEILEVCNTYLRFKVKDAHGHTVKTEKKIVGITLDARL